MASIYKINKKGYLLHADRKAISGFLLAWQPFIRISENDYTSEIIPNAIKEIIEESENTERVPDPKSWSENSKQFLKNTGLKSSKELYIITTKHCGISRENENIFFTPSKHAEKPDVGFLYKKRDEAITIPYTSSDKEIFQALELAFSRCE